MRSTSTYDPDKGKTPSVNINIGLGHIKCHLGHINIGSVNMVSKIWTPQHRSWQVQERSSTHQHAFSSHQQPFRQPKTPSWHFAMRSWPSTAQCSPLVMAFCSLHNKVVHQPESAGLAQRLFHKPPASVQLTNSPSDLTSPKTCPFPYAMGHPGHIGSTHQHNVEMVWGPHGLVTFPIPLQLYSLNQYLTPH